MVRGNSHSTLRSSISGMFRTCSLMPWNISILPAASDMQSMMLNSYPAAAAHDGRSQKCSNVNLIFPPHCFDNLKLSTAGFINVPQVTLVACSAHVNFVFHQFVSTICAFHSHHSSPVNLAINAPSFDSFLTPTPPRNSH